MEECRSYLLRAGGRHYFHLFGQALWHVRSEMLDRALYVRAGLLFEHGIAGLRSTVCLYSLKMEPQLFSDKNAASVVYKLLF